MENKTKARIKGFIYLLLLCIPCRVWANGIPMLLTQYGVSRSVWLPILFGIPTIYIEFLVIKAMISFKKKWLLLIIVTLVHIISYPLTFFTAFFISILAEIIPIILEPYLYGRVFNRFFQGNTSDKKLPYSKIWKVVFFANLGSFGVGVIINVIIWSIS